MISELRADLTNLVGEPRLEKISFFLGIPKFGCQLFVKREIIYDGHEASIGEADLLLAFCCLHLDENVVPLLVVFLSFFCVVYVGCVVGGVAVHTVALALASSARQVVTQSMICPQD